MGLLTAVVGLLVLVGGGAVMLGSALGSSAFPAAGAFGERPPGEGGTAELAADGAATEADGVLPDGVGAFDEQYPGVVNLDPALLGALRAAAADAAEEGIEVFVSSGWRSPGYQEQLLEEAVAEYGSEAEAARWVATAETSEHVAGNAVDVGSYDAIDWLQEHGARYGLCPTYDNEPWHFERHAEAIDEGCPAVYWDPTRDPRMQG
ncbi:D-alanyl-D-alanine carboxypeptidase family protein [Agromyces sp. PvR057]|uniref:D-alanyl-D-alanine carboxypeptidase family protein n=1 Tax=Agromyces sp. PvR057 TaxID=3156403 RepID=UPI0033976B97